MERTKMTLKDLAVSFHFPKFSTSRDFYKAFGCRVCMLLSYQMISVYQLYIVEDYVHQTKTEAAGTIATMSIITMVVSLSASLISGPISDKMHTRAQGTSHHRLAAVRDWHRDAVDHAERHGHVPVCGHRRLGYGVYSAIDQALNVDVLPNKEEAGKDLGILNLATTLGQAVGPTITSTVKTATGALRLHSPSPSSWPCAPPCSCCAFRR